MKHSFKLPDGEIITIDGKIGSDIVDCNDREIFEGDVILTPNWERPLKIIWADSSLLVVDPVDCSSFATVSLWGYLDSDCTVVGGDDFDWSVWESDIL